MGLRNPSARRNSTVRGTEPSQGRMTAAPAVRRGSPMPNVAAPAPWQLLSLQIPVCLGTMLEHDADVAQMARAPLS